MLRKDIYSEVLRSWNLEILASSAQLHDVGKVKVSDLILNKPGKLTDEEFDQVKKHCDDGESIIDKIITWARDDSYLIHAKRFAASHHERWDGSGYPLGLKGEDIPLEGRIMAIADVYDALVSERPYKAPIPHAEAVEIIKADAGTHFDPKLVEVFLSAAHEFALVFPDGAHS
jgi:putative two-component system response regulator